MVYIQLDLRQMKDEEEIRESWTLQKSEESSTKSENVLNTNGRHSQA